MTPSNRQLLLITISCVAAYIIILLLYIVGFTGVEGVLVLNLLTSFSILCYWARKQLRITKYYFEFREVLVLGIEAIIVGLSIFALLHPSPAWLNVAGCAFFGLHFIALLLFLLFTLTFKMKKLF